MEDRESILQRLATQLSALESLLDGVPRADLDSHVGGKWSATENVAHLARHTELTIQRVKRILAEDGAEFPPYRAEEDPDWERWRSLSFEESVERLRNARAALIAVVEGVSGMQLARIGRHTRLGPLSLLAWLDFYLVHEGHHLYILTKRARGLE